MGFVTGMNSSAYAELLSHRAMEDAEYRMFVLLRR